MLQRWSSRVKLLSIVELKKKEESNEEIRRVSYKGICGSETYKGMSYSHSSRVYENRIKGTRIYCRILVMWISVEGQFSVVKFVDSFGKCIMNDCSISCCSKFWEFWIVTLGFIN